MKKMSDEELRDYARATRMDDPLISDLASELLELRAFKRAVAETQRPPSALTPEEKEARIQLATFFQGGGF